MSSTCTQSQVCAATPISSFVSHVFTRIDTCERVTHTHSENVIQARGRTREIKQRSTRLLEEKHSPTYTFVEIS